MVSNLRALGACEPCNRVRIRERKAYKRAESGFESSDARDSDVIELSNDAAVRGEVYCFAPSAVRNSRSEMLIKLCVPIL